MAASNSPHRRNIFSTPTPHNRHSKSPPATTRPAPYTIKPRSTFGKFTPLRKSHTTIPQTTNVLGLSHRNELNRRKSGLSRPATFSPDPFDSENVPTAEKEDVEMDMGNGEKDSSNETDDFLTFDGNHAGSPVSKRRTTGLFATPAPPIFETPRHDPPQLNTTTPFGTPAFGKNAPVSDKLFPDTPSRSSGLKRYVKQGETERPNFARSRPAARLSEFATPLHPASATRKIPTATGDFPTSKEPGTPFALNRNSASAYGKPSEQRVMFTEGRPVFSKSLNALSGRHSLGGPTLGANESNNWVTPQNYKFARPNQAAFHSTGFVPKRGRNLTSESLASHQPETPCKKTSSFTARPKGLKSPSGASVLSFNRSLQRIDSFCSMTGDDNEEDSPTALPGDFDMPPTPTKRGGLFGSLTKRSRGDSNGSPLGNRLSLAATIPQTPTHSDSPSESAAPATGRRSSFFANSPVKQSTPTNEFFDFLKPGKTPFRPRSSSITDLEASPSIPRRNSTGSLTQRFAQVKPVGTGEFSEVFMVTEGSPKQKAPGTTLDDVPSTPAVVGASFSTPPQRGNRIQTPTSGRTFAVKKFKQQYHGIRDRERKMEEVNILKALGKNEHIIEYIDSWEEDRKIYIMTEYCEGGSLDRFLDEIGNKGRLDEFRVWKILLELCLGLSHIHNSGFIHLDIKPANVLISSEGALKISDFGMASKWPAPAGIEREGDKIYIAPEILQGGKYDKPADIFSLGLSMIEIAVNETLPPNGPLWQSLRKGDLTVAPVLSTSRSGELIIRDQDGVPVAVEAVGDHDSAYASSSFSASSIDESSPPIDSLLKRTGSGPLLHKPRPGDLIYPPRFMENGGLERIISGMICDEPSRRYTANDILALDEIQWVNNRRTQGATIFEGLWGPDIDDSMDSIDTAPTTDSTSLEYDGDEDWRMEM
ncbi:kinase-like protein [Ascobolus immersus RN42]|uniref:Kinase-like protein n=1 Tax=Ascobolus immersus RN42 TaxID=1160509 RepID=A0A3N4I0N1_ASCIM|nr:kinase-like protein [Ascobolus immersus RN42]